jgi:hypothetical protein
MPTIVRSEPLCDLPVPIAAIGGPQFQSVIGICHTPQHCRMTMFSFRVDDEEAIRTQQWAEALGVDRSELLRDALHRHLVRLAADQRLRDATGC